MAEGEMRQKMTEEGRVFFLHQRYPFPEENSSSDFFPPTHTVLD
jgi:hypothetical protein